jgi:cysteine desulfurase
MPQKIYLDYAASTPVDPRVLKVMRPYFEKDYGNPGSLHSFGQAALAAVDAARENVAAALKAEFREIIFTGSATEANNLALRGAVAAFRKNFPERLPQVIVSGVEHESVLATARDLEAAGVYIVIIPAGKNGRVALKDVVAALSPDTALVSIMHGNNETGAVMPIEEIAKAVAAFRGAGSWPLFHTDAAQTLQFLPVEEAGADLITISGHKIGGPKGIGALYIRANGQRLLAKNGLNTLLLQPILTGGGQEYGLRSGTENVPAIAGFGKAVALAVAERRERTAHASRMKEKFRKGVIKLGARLHPGDLPHILNFYFPGVDSGDILVALDREGLAISSGAACSARSSTPSHVLLAMGIPEKEVRSSFRASFGTATTAAEVGRALSVISKIMRRMRKR